MTVRKNNFLKVEKGQVSERNNENQETSSSPLITSHSDDNKKKVVPAGPDKTKLRQYQEDTGKFFYTYLKNRIFDGRPEIRETAHEKAKKYVAENYFVNTVSMKEADLLLKKLQWRVDLAARWIKQNNFEMKHIFPLQYLDIERKGTNPHTGKPYMSFVNLALWEKNYREMKKADKIKRAKDSRERAYQKVLKAFLETPKIEMYGKCLEYLKDKLPEYSEKFLCEISNKHTA